MSGRASTWRPAAVVAALATAGLAVPAAMGLSPALPDPQIVDGPAFVQVTVPVTGGTLREREGQIEAVDSEPADGGASVLVTASGRRVQTSELGQAGVRVRTSITSRGSLIELTGARGRFVFVSYRVASGGTMLAIRLWKSDPVFPGAALRDDGCLRITRVAGTTGRVSARGLELEPIFEHNVVLQLRDAAGRSVALKPVTAREGRFRPDFSGYLTPGTWSGTVTHRVARRQRGVFQAWSRSVRDGALECLVQVPVTLAPRAR